MGKLPGILLPLLLPNHNSFKHLFFLPAAASLLWTLNVYPDNSTACLIMAQLENIWLAWPESSVHVRANQLWLKGVGGVRDVTNKPVAPILGMREGKHSEEGPSMSNSISRVYIYLKSCHYCYALALTPNDKQFEVWFYICACSAARSTWPRIVMTVSLSYRSLLKPFLAFC
jgi:hypothetical protein